MVAADGVWRRWRILYISSTVRVVVCGGACGSGGGVIISPVCWCFMNVVWVDGGRYACVVVCGGERGGYRGWYCGLGV